MPEYPTRPSQPAHPYGPGPDDDDPQDRHDRSGQGPAPNSAPNPAQGRWSGDEVGHEQPRSLGARGERYPGAQYRDERPRGEARLGEGQGSEGRASGRHPDGWSGGHQREGYQDARPRDDRHPGNRNAGAQNERYRDNRYQDEAFHNEQPRNEHPRNDRLGDGRPHEDRLRDGRTRDGQPRNVQTRGAQPHDSQPRDSQPRDGRGRDERPGRSSERRSAYSLQDRQSQDQFPAGQVGRRALREAEPARREADTARQIAEERRQRAAEEHPEDGRRENRGQGWTGRSRVGSSQQQRQQQRSGEQSRSRYAGRLGPLTAATSILKRIVPARRGGTGDETNPNGLHPDGAPELNSRSQRSSFFDMESEERAPGNGNGASFPSLGGSGRSTPPPPTPRSFRQTRRSGRRRVPIIAAVVAALMVIGGVAYALGNGDDQNSGTTASATPTSSASASGSGDATTTTAPATTGAEKKVKLGVFRGTSPSEVGQFSDWLGRDVDYAVDYSTRTSWDEIANPTYMLGTWRNSGYTMVYAVAMLPTRDSTASLASGAKGNYDQYYKTLAQNLVNYGQGDSIIRLGWEFNVAGWPWHPGADDQDDFIAYWRHIVKAMRSVDGAENLKFDWNVNNGGDSYDSTIFYPGNKYVDYIGVDVYDTSWEDDTYPYPSGCDSSCRLERQENAWANTVDAKYGLVFWSDFAEAQGKPMSFPEWGLWDRPDGQGGADNPYFIQQMYEFIDNPQNNVAYQAYFEFDAEDRGNHMLEELTKGGAKFKKLFSK
ncbi:hypothetical protein KIH74_00800 [Kineosporia sp. J2-2]|uniref:GH26 domain-containing protein n=1 Tax=Kineosporia corallincola TaxID=2835133 RepID=A0ABS5TCT4_9ACTN|nr:glycosyl hydrolase [Kineosporia corallincola]MBT0767439.1 hypothetical protein [Kineosporia corallincola]